MWLLNSFLHKAFSPKIADFSFEILRCSRHFSVENCPPVLYWTNRAPHSNNTPSVSITTNAVWFTPFWRSIIKFTIRYRNKATWGSSNRFSPCLIEAYLVQSNSLKNDYIFCFLTNVCEAAIFMELIANPKYSISWQWLKVDFSGCITKVLTIVK